MEPHYLFLAAYSAKKLIMLGIGVPLLVSVGMWLYSEINKYREAQNADKKKEAFTQMMIAIVLMLILIGFCGYLGLDFMGLLKMDGIDDLAPGT